LISSQIQAVRGANISPAHLSGAFGRRRTAGLWQGVLDVSGSGPTDTTKRVPTTRYFGWSGLAPDATRSKRDFDGWNLD